MDRIGGTAGTAGTNAKAFGYALRERLQSPSGHFHPDATNEELDDPVEKKVARGIPLNLAPHCFLLCLITQTPLDGRNPNSYPFYTTSRARFLVSMQFAQFSATK